jgi:predicted nucleotidyltransferase
MLDALMPSARVKVLAFLLVNAAESFHLREIARRSGVPLRAVQRELGLLERIALVERERRGRQVFVHVRMSHPLYLDLRSMVLKTVGLAAPLRERLEAVGGVAMAVVYGSVAAGNDAGDSDVDLLVVGSPDELEVHEALASFEENLGRPVNYTLMSADEFRTRIRDGDPFLRRVLAGELIHVIGDPDAV